MLGFVQNIQNRPETGFPKGGFECYSKKKIFVIASLGILSTPPTNFDTIISCFICAGEIGYRGLGSSTGNREVHLKRGSAQAPQTPSGYRPAKGG